MIAVAPNVKEARKLARAEEPMPALRKLIAGKPTSVHKAPHAIHDVY